MNKKKTASVMKTFDLEKGEFPNVLLTGNGLSIECSRQSTTDIMKKILRKYRKTNGAKSINDINGLPFPMQVVIASNDDVAGACLMLKEEMIKKEYYSDNHVYTDFLKLDMDAFLTTNYSYDYEMACDDSFLSHMHKNATYTEWCRKYKNGKMAGEFLRESKEQLHSFYRMKYANSDKDIWHIHGEAKNVNSMVLGNYYYGNQLASYVVECKRYGEMWENKDDQILKPKSWLDYFVFGNVYIVGFGMGFGEMDLWWLLNRKKRETRNHGKTILFVKDMSELNNEMRSMLSVYDVRIFCTDKKTYKDHYADCLMHIKNKDFYDDLI